MGLFDFFQSKQKQAPQPVIKETPWAPEARGYLTDLMNSPSPLQGTAGMSGNEQASQDILASILKGDTFQDPAQSMYYQGLRGQMQAEEADAVNALRRRAQMSGMTNSSSAYGAEGRLRSSYSNQRMNILGNLYNQERQMDNPYTRLQAGMQYGSLPRQIEQQKLNAQFNQQMMPYQVQSQIAGQLLNYQPWYQPQFYQEPSMFSQLAPLLGTAAQAGASMYGANKIAGAMTAQKQSPLQQFAGNSNNFNWMNLR